MINTKVVHWASPYKRMLLCRYEAGIYADVPSMDIDLRVPVTCLLCLGHMSLGQVTNSIWTRKVTRDE
jgi:hypothetical protein